MSNFAKLLMEAAENYEQAQIRSDVTLGTVSSVNPLSVDIGDGITLSGAELMITEGCVWKATKPWNGMPATRFQNEKPMREHPNSTSLIPYLTIQDGLMPGDRVVLVRARGGQTFVVLGRVYREV